LKKTSNFVNNLLLKAFIWRFSPLICGELPIGRPFSMLSMEDFDPKACVLYFFVELDNSVYHTHVPERTPTFAGPIHNVTVNVGREAVLECPVNHLGQYKVKMR
jgi:hypothetical protein